MRELENEYENEFQCEECTKELTTSLKDLFMKATISSISLVGLSIIVAFYFKMEDIIIFSMLLISWLISTIVTIPVKQIQSLIIVEGIIKKPLGYFSLKVETIGCGKNKGQCLMICPIAKSKELNKFFEDILPQINITYDLRNSSPKALNGFLLFRLIEEGIQSFEKQQNIFQKRKAIAKYKVIIAGNSLGKSYVVKYISENNYKSNDSKVVINL